MRFLLDVGISPRVRDDLISLGYDAVRCSDIGFAKSSDNSILEHAQAHGLILVSIDLDFADLAISCPTPCPGVILLRLNNPTAEMMCSRLRIALTGLEEDDIVGSIVVIQQDRVRTRKL